MTNKTRGLYKRFYAVIRKIPRGRVATYGQIARIAGMPRHARHVGYALAVLPDEETLPWHRVLNSKGEISAREHPDSAQHQRALLEREKVIFNEAGRIALRRFQWKPDC